jgi:excisionase family DNA binding protein
LLLENELNGGGPIDRLLSVRDVAATLSVSTATVYGLCRDGQLPHVRVLNTIRVRPEDLSRFVTAATHKGRGQR